MARGTTEHECTSCGGPLSIPGEGERYSTCDFCGTVVELDLPPEPDDEPPSTSINITVAEPIAATGLRVGALVILAVVVAVGAAIFAMVDATSTQMGVPDVSGEIQDVLDGLGVGGVGGDNATGLHSISAARLLTAEDDTSPDVFAVGNAPGSETSMVLLDAESDDGVRWRASVPETDVYLVVQPTSDRLYLSLKDTIRSVDRADGTTVWSAELSDLVHHNICTDCFQRFDDLLVVLTTDGVLTGFEAADGTLRWERTLAETLRQILDMDGRPAVFDVVDDVRTLHVLDPAEGTTVQQVPVSCPDTTFGGRDEVGPYAHLVPIGGGSFVYVSDDPSSACAQRWDPGAEGAAWEVAVDLPFAMQVDTDHVRVADGRLHLAHRDRAISIDLATGTTVSDVTGADHDLVPVLATGDTLVVGAASTRGTRDWVLWGVDVATQTVAWTRELDAGEVVGAWATPVRDAGTWTAVLTNGGVTVVEMFDGPARATLTTLDPATGAAVTDHTLLLDETPALTVDVLASRGDRLWLRVDTSVLVVDASTGEVSARIP